MKFDGVNSICHIYRHGNGLVKSCKESMEVGGNQVGYVYAKFKIIQYFNKEKVIKWIK